MLKLFYRSLFVFFLAGCSGFEFVYNDSLETNEIKGKTYLSIGGDNTEIIYAYAINKIQNNNTNNKYNLSINSKKTIEAMVVEKDATASKFNIKLNISYILSNNENNCVILEKNLITNSRYASKSAGYSFGTDLSEEESLVRNIHSNIDEFLSYLFRSEINFNC